MVPFQCYCSWALTISIASYISSLMVLTSRRLLLSKLPYLHFGTYMAVLLPPYSSSSSSSCGLTLTNSLIWSGSSSYSRWYTVRMSLVVVRHLLRQLCSGGCFWSYGFWARRKAISARRTPDFFSFQTQIRQRPSNLIAAATLFLNYLESQSRLLGGTQNRDYYDCWIRVRNSLSQYFWTRFSSVSLSSARSPQVCSAPILAFSSPHQQAFTTPSKTRLRFSAEWLHISCSTALNSSFAESSYHYYCTSPVALVAIVKIRSTSWQSQVYILLLSSGKNLAKLFSAISVSFSANRDLRATAFMVDLE